MKAIISQVSENRFVYSLAACVLWKGYSNCQTINSFSRDRKDYFLFIKQCKCWIIEIIPARRFTISPALNAVMRSFLNLGSADWRRVLSSISILCNCVTFNEINCCICFSLRTIYIHIANHNIFWWQIWKSVIFH